MVLYTKSILKKRSPGEGARISVMNRHTLEDGVTCDLRITRESYDEHLVDLAPPSKLLGDYYLRGLGWDEYERRYLEHIRGDGVAQKVEELAGRAVAENITLLCIEESADKCHRRLLAEECQRYRSDLEVAHL